MKKPFVISVSGISGSGKTTIAHALNKRLNSSAIICFDDYGDSVYLDRNINEWSMNSENADEWHLEPIVVDIERLLKTSLDYIILDYPFGYENQFVAQYIDFTVFVDIPFDVALARRIIRDYTKRDESGSVADVKEVSLEGLESELQFYLTCSRLTYIRMPEKQKSNTDLVVDGTKTPEEIAKSIITLLSAMNRGCDL
jgi:uridine kinase